jgi:hypothetical protein
LEFVRNLSCEEAKLLERVGEIAIRVQDTCFIDVHDKEWIEAKYGIRAEHHFSLGELNILYPTDLAIHFFQESESKLVFARGDTILSVEQGKASQACKLPVWKFTSVGQELLTLVATRDDKPLLENLGRFFVKNGATASIGTIIERMADNSYKCVMEPPLTI